MSVATDFRSVKRRIDGYLWQDRSEPLKTLREFFEEHLSQFSHAAILGGLARDFALRGRQGFKSDVDIVVDGPAEQVMVLASKLQAVPNRFGGYIYKGPRWKIDFWALETTWAGKEGHVPISSMEDLLSATFFDCDAILYDLNRRSVIAAEGYLEKLKAQTIEINLKPNPSISGNVLRAVRRILLWNLEPGPKLQTFLHEMLTERLFKEISEVEQKLYANNVTSRFENADDLLEALFSENQRLSFGTTSAQQMSLPEI